MTDRKSPTRDRLTHDSFQPAFERRGHGREQSSHQPGKQSVTTTSERKGPPPKPTKR